MTGRNHSARSGSEAARSRWVAPPLLYPADDVPHFVDDMATLSGQLPLVVEVQ
jgi:hypothetical protein